MEKNNEEILYIHNDDEISDDEELYDEIDEEIEKEIEKENIYTAAVQGYFDIKQYINDNMLNMAEYLTINDLQDFIDIYCLV